jgi:hypothetical protein
MISRRWWLVPVLCCGLGALGESPARAMAEDGWVDVKRDFKAVGDGVADDTRAVQDAMTYAEANGKPVRIPAGVYLVGPISLGNPATQALRSPSGQSSSVTRIQGAGRGYVCILKAKPGAYHGEQYVLTRRNLAGVHYSDFCISGNGVAYGGLDFSFNYDVAGAPSSTNVLENVWIEGCTKIGANLDGFHDSKVSGLLIRGIGGFDNAPVGLSFRGPGGLMMISDTIIESGIVRTSAQNGEFARCGFFNGLEVTDGGYNHINFNACHFYTNPRTGISLDSTSVGNATCALQLNGCYFNGGGNFYIAGQFHAGAEFNNCMFYSPGRAFFGPIAAAEGRGQVPFFVFRFCTFNGTDPVATTPVTTARVKAEYCHQPAGISELRKNW